MPTTNLRGSEIFSSLFIIFVATGCSTSDKPLDFRLNVNYTVHDPQFAQVVQRLLGPPLLPGNSCVTLVNGKEIFPAMLGAIRSARRTITLETYIYWSGKIGQEFTDALSDRARAGVKVDVMMDWYGSEPIKGQYIDQMRRAGCSVIEYHPFHLWDPSTWRHLDNRTHRKLMVVDGRIGFIGGVGIADIWRGNAEDSAHWRDNHYQLEGPVVGQLQSAFMDNWITTTGEVLATDDFFPPIAQSGGLRAQVFSSSATGGSESMQLLMLLSFAAAAHDLRLESAYFVPDETTRHSLIQARRRGVSVQIIVPGRHIDEKLVRSASRSTWGDLLKAGVEIYEYQPTMFHCKQMIVDGIWVSIGSSNLDNRSFRLNDEANLNVLDEGFANSQIRIFDMDKQRAKRITYEQWQDRPLAEKLSESLAHMLAWEF